MESLIQDFRYALRQLAKSPGFTLVAVVTLALGIGANTAVFTLANWVVLRPLPGVERHGGLVSLGLSTARGGFPGMSYPALREFSAEFQALESFAGAMRPMQLPVASGAAPPRMLKVSFVSGNFFQALQVRPFIGRTLAPSEENPSSQPVAVVSHALWTSFLQSDQGVTGRTVRINQLHVPVVGVAPEGFQGIDRLSQSDVWLLASALPAVSGEPSWDIMGNRRGGIFYDFFGRLAPGATLAQVEEQARVIGNRVASANPEGNQSWVDVRAIARNGIGVSISAREKVDSTLRLLVGIAAVVLLIAAANFANLLLFRGVRRRGETAVRLALGASRLRLIREGLTESILLSFIAGVAALLLSVWLVGVFRGATIAGLPAIETIRLDGTVLGVGLASALLIGVAAGMIAPLANRSSVSAVLKDTAGKGSRRAWLRGGLVVIQLAASLTLLVGAGLLVSTLRNLRSVDVGFDARYAHVFSINPGRAGYSGERSAELLTELRRHVAAIPGVDRTSFAYMAPFSGWSMGNSAKSRFLAPGAKASVTDAWVSPGYFETLGIPVQRGRDFSEAEFARPGGPEGVTVISSSLARELFGDRDPLGEYVTSVRSNGRRLVDTAYRVVGVVGDSKWERVAGFDAAGAVMYHLLGEGPTAIGQAPGVTVMVRSLLPATDVRPLVESTIARLAPTIPLMEVASLQDKIDRTLAEQRLFARIISMLTLLAVGLAGIGLYGLVGFAVAERTREFGIRMALGAQVEQVLNLVIRKGAWLAGLGIILGGAGALVLSKLIATRLFGVVPLEPFVYILAVSLLILLTIVASVVPARAATRVDPMVALRSE